MTIPRSLRLWLIAGPMLIPVFLLLASLVPYVGSGPASKRMVCQNKMRQILLALENYRHEHGSYPPPCVFDQDGKAMHSWRVLLLPYLEEDLLFNAYDFGQPWNSPANSEVSRTCPSIYRCPAQTRGRQTSTAFSYLAVLGPGTAWLRSDGKEKHGKKEKRILLVEVADSQVSWTEPKDLTIEDIMMGISGSHSGGANVGFSDGSVEFLPADTPGERLRSMCECPEN